MRIERNRLGRSGLVAVGLATMLLGACGGSGTKSSSSGETSAPTAGAGSGASAGDHVPSGGTVEIGSVYSRTGIYSAYGTPAAQGVAMAVNEINQTGFVVAGKRYTFKLDAADTQSSIPVGVSKVHQMVSGDHDVAIFGPVISAIAVPAAAYSSAHGVVEITPSTDLYALLASKPSDYKYVLNTQAGEGPAETVAEKAYITAHNIKTVAILQATDDTGDIGLKIDTQDMNAFGVKIVYSAKFPDATSDFSPYVAKVTAAHPDLLLLPYADTWEVPILTLAREQKSAIYYRGNDLLPALHSGSTPAANFFFETNLPNQFNPTPAMTKFIDDFQTFNHTQVTPTTYFSYAFSSYPEVYQLVKAMQAAQSVTDDAAIMKQLRGSTMTTPGGFMLPLTFNQQGQISTFDEQCVITTGGVSGMSCKQYS